MRTYCNTAALNAKKAETLASLEETRDLRIKEATARAIVRTMASSVDYMRGRPKHHVWQQLGWCGYGQREIANNIDAVMTVIGTERLH